MAQEESQNPQPSSSNDKPKRIRAEQDQRIANDIADWLKQIKAAQADPEIATLLAERGYEASDLNEGLALQLKCDGAFAARQTAWGEQLAATQALEAETKVAREEYMGFRKIAREMFRGDADWVTLGLNGRVSPDLEKFSTAATASYRAAKGPAYIDKLTKRGYSPTNLGGLIAAIGKLAESGAAQAQAEGKAKAATATRDKAYEDLKSWIKEFNATARVVLRKHTGLLARLDL